MAGFNPQIIPDVPVKDSFKEYVNIVAEVIRNSEPQFTVGVFGGWGIGKTSFLRSLEKELNKDKNIVVVFFNAWRYERENYYATLPLLKSLYFALENWSSQNKSLNKRTKEKISKTLKIIGGIIKSIQVEVQPIPGLSVSLQPADAFEKEKENIEILAQISSEKNIYYDVFRYLENAIEDIRRENKGFRIVILVDDLDRCSPEKAIEILNSIKIFLDIEGVVYVLALNQSVIKELLNWHYDRMGLSGDKYSSEDYFSKFFQVMINLPEWDKEEIAEKIIDDIFKKTKLSHEIDTGRLERIRAKIVNALEDSLTPREIKRFLNTFVLRYALAKNINKKERLGIKEGELLEIVLDISIIDYLWHGLVSRLEKGNEDDFSQLQKIIENKDANLEDYDLDLKEDDIKKLGDLLKDSPFLKLRYPIIKKILKIRSTIRRESHESDEIPFVLSLKKNAYDRNLHSLAFTHALNLLSKHYSLNNILIEPEINVKNQRIQPDLVVITSHEYIPIEIKIGTISLDRKIYRLLKIFDTKPNYLGKLLEKIVIIVYTPNPQLTIQRRIIHPMLAGRVEITDNLLDAIADERTKGKIIIVIQSIEEVKKLIETKSTSIENWT